MISIKQIKAARVLLEWKQSDLAKASKLSLPTINNIERGIGSPKAETLDLIRNSLESNGIEFIDEIGVQLKGEILNFQMLEGVEGLKKLLDDVYETLKPLKGEVLISGLDERFFTEKLGDGLKQHIARLAAAGIKERLLIREGDDFLVAPKEDYRKIPEELFSQMPYYVYAGKCAFILWGPPLKILLIENAPLVESFKKQFERNWQNASKA